MFTHTSKNITGSRFVIRFKIIRCKIFNVCLFCNFRHERVKNISKKVMMEFAVISYYFSLYADISWHDIQLFFNCQTIICRAHQPLKHTQHAKKPSTQARKQQGRQEHGQASVWASKHAKHASMRSTWDRKHVKHVIYQI